MKNSFVIGVSQLNMYIKSLIDGDMNLNNVYLKGEISNFTNHYRTGHFYFSLKDSQATVRAVMFRSSAQRLQFMPENGMSVLVRGRVSVFERDGQYQVYVEDMQPDGAGALSVAFEQLKAHLAEEGIFDDSRKKRIPKYPSRVAVITSPTGAAVRDILNILGRRFPVAEIIMCSVQVQGMNAAPQLVDALQRVNRIKAADVIIIGRGGGSIEDLWAFNDEKLARAVAESDIPVISAVGHETDFTICDFAADLRAPTPSAAAELAVPDAREQKQLLADSVYTCMSLLNRKIHEDRMNLKLICSSNAFKNPMYTVEFNRQLTDKLYSSAAHLLATRLTEQKNRLSRACGKLDTLSPLKVLARGYGVAHRGAAAVLSVRDVRLNDNIELRLYDGVLECTVNGKRETV